MQGAPAETSGRSIPLVSIGWIHPFLQILEDVGAPYERLLEAADLPVLAVDEGSLLVPTEKIYRFVRLAAEATRLPDLGLCAGSRLDLESVLPTVDLLWGRPGVFRTLDSFINLCLESSSNVDLWIESRPAPENLVEFFYRGTFGHAHPAFRMVEQFMVAVMVRITRVAAGRAWCPALVNLRASSVPAVAMRKLVPESEVRCEQTKTSIAFRPGPVVRIEPFPAPVSGIWKHHKRSLASWPPGDDLARSLRLVLRAYLPDGSPGIELAASLCGLSVRTLQRRLDQQGVTYSDLLDDLRHDLAIYLLRDPKREAAAVSRELGYRDPAIFTRAFRRWTGQTPSQYRRAQT